MSEYQQVQVLEPPDESELFNLSPATIFQIAWKIQEADHDPEDAKLLLHKFCDLYKKSEPIPPQLLRFINDSFCAYLNGEHKQLETAFGLTNKTRTKSYSEEVAFQICEYIWERRLAGDKPGTVMHDAINHFGWGKNTTETIWKGNRWDALISYRLQLRDSGRDLSADEIKIANKILKAERQKIQALLGNDIPQ